MADILQEQSFTSGSSFQRGDVVRAVYRAPYMRTRDPAIMRVLDVREREDQIKVEIIQNSPYLGQSYWVETRYFYKIDGVPEQTSWVIKDREGKMVKEDWIVRNWDFLKARKVVSIPMSRARNILREGQVLTTGKFYGNQEFIDQMDSYSAIRYNGTRTLFLRPFISAPMPEGVLAVYVDPKRYNFDDNGIVTGLSSTYEFPIYVFKD